MEHNKLDQMQAIKIVVVGDGNVGKTSMIMKFTTDTFPEDFTPQVFENCSATLAVEGSPFTLNIWDVAGQEEYDRLRPLTYPNTDVFIFCFAVDSLTSFQNITIRWWLEVAHHAPDVPFMLVGNKIDLREDETAQYSHAPHISSQQGEQLREQIKAAAYLECSALTQQGLKEVFYEAARVVKLHRARCQQSCTCCEQPRLDVQN